MSDHDAIDSFTGKWRERWPEWRVAEVFVPEGQRSVALAWAALVQELTDAAWGGSDPRPGEAKLGWWMEELQGWSRGARRHPLGAVLHRLPAPWPALAESLPALRDSRDRPLDRDHARRQLEAFAAPVAAVDEALFGVARPDHAATSGDAVTANLLHLRIAHHPGGAVPLQAIAAAGEGEGLAAAEWTRTLASMPFPVGGTRPRRLWVALATGRLRRGDAARPLPLPSALWTAWRAARG